MLTSGRNTVEVANMAQTLVLPVAAATKIYEGSLVVLDASGYAKPAEKAEDLTAVGRAEHLADNSNGSAGEATIEVKRGVFLWENDTNAESAVTIAEVMKPCYIKDDCTVTKAATGSSVAGKVVGVFEDGTVAVETI